MYGKIESIRNNTDQMKALMTVGDAWRMAVNDRVAQVHQKIQGGVHNIGGLRQKLQIFDAGSVKTWGALRRTQKGKKRISKNQNLDAHYQRKNGLRYDTSHVPNKRKQEPRQDSHNCDNKRTQHRKRKETAGGNRKWARTRRRRT